MNNSQKLKSKFPIICSGMNRVSDVNLALAVKQEGCYPSLVAFNHLILDPVTKKATNDASKLTEAMATYCEQAGDSEFILGVSSPLLLKWKNAMAAIYKYKPAYVELFDTDGFEAENPSEFYDIIKKLQQNGTKVLVKALSATTPLSKKEMCEAIDGIIVKGSKAAGRVAHAEVNLVDAVKTLREYRDDWVIIAQGGVHDSAGIKELLEAGATAVSMGTIFALSAESTISNETKQKMLEASYADTVRIGEANQNGLLFTKTENDVENNTIGLARGVATGVVGHVFAGAAIDHITEIKPVSQIVAELTMGL
jgi:NAD(P)H-dependent flavin oxidoreductase YrpB (nitropropane dioxygenase family)